MGKKVNFICTIGPSTYDQDTIKKMYELGMRIARFNMSYADTHVLESLNQIRRVNETYGYNIKTMFDLAGPEIRTVLNQDLKFKKGDILILGVDFNMSQGNSAILKRKDILTFKDAEDALMVVNSKNNYVYCKALNSGIINNKNKIYNERLYNNLPFLSEDDIEAINLAIKEKIDYLALSFVKSKDEINLVKDMIKSSTNSKIKIVSKIENMMGIKNLREIISNSDEIMIARGDLGTCIPLLELGKWQKKIAKAVVLAKKPLIIATGILGSLETNKTPSRAEILDLYNIILDGAAKILFSNETAASINPLNVLETANKIIDSVSK